MSTVLTRLFRRSRTPARRPARLRIEALDGRLLPSVAAVAFDGHTVTIRADDTATAVTLSRHDDTIVIHESGTAHTWSYAAADVALVEFVGGAGNDRFVD